MKSDMIFLQDAGIWIHHLVPGDGKHRTTLLTGPKGWEANLTITDETPPNSEGVTPITGVLECYACLDETDGTLLYTKWTVRTLNIHTTVPCLPQSVELLGRGP